MDSEKRRWIDTRYRFVALASIAIICLVAAACSDGAGDSAVSPVDAPRANPIGVVTTTTIFADFVRQVGGDRVAVQSIVPATADVHTFAIVPSAIRAVKSADLVVLGGDGLEASFEDAVKANASGALIFLTDGLALRELAPQFQSDGAESRDRRTVDPHFWMDVGLAIRAVDAIRAALVATDPAGATEYTANAMNYVAELERLDREITDLLDALPPQRRTLVTFHDAFGYFAARYNLEILGFLVEGPEEEPTAGDVAALIKAIESRGLSFIFTEPQFNADLVQRVANEAGVKVRVLYSGFLSDDRPTYIDLMRDNARAVAN